MTKYIWKKQKTDIKEVIQAAHDPIKEWNQDPNGYFLIRVNHKDKKIEVGFVSNDHVITKQILGKNAIEIYNTIIRHKLITRLEHAAYLGKELYKAELCLQTETKYVQEFSPKFDEKVKVIIGN